MSLPTLRSAAEYLEQLPGNQLKRLYQQPSTALAVFRRMLPHIAKTLVMAMLYMHDPLPANHLEAWIKDNSRRERDISLELLERLNILSVIEGADKQRTYRLSKPFVTSLRLALTGGGDHRSFGVPCDTPDDKKVSWDFLAEYARSRWDGILYFIVGSVGGKGDDANRKRRATNISEGSTSLLEMGSFVQAHGSSYRITQAGFSFLLQDVNTQIWNLLIVYLENAEYLQMDSTEVLSFLFTLGSLETGQDYSTETLSKTQLQMLDDLSDLGLVYRPSSSEPGPSRFYPTQLAMTLNTDSSTVSSALTNDTGLSSSPESSDTSTDQKGFIIVETNYRIYAYTNSQLRIDILGLFTKLGTRFPNMISGKLTKESIQRAIALGITAEQIISYLTTYAHPVMNSNSRTSKQTDASTGRHLNPAVPPTVVDQIRLWQIEGDRMKTTTGFLLKDFVDSRQYKECIEYADLIGVLVWKDNNRRCCFVTRHEQIGGFLQRSQEKRGNAQNSSKTSNGDTAKQR